MKHAYTTVRKNTTKQHAPHEMGKGDVRRSPAARVEQQAVKSIAKTSGRMGPRKTY